MSRNSKCNSSAKLRILILCISQFGYLLDTYYYCKHGRELLDITYMGFEGSRPTVTLDGVSIKTVSRKGNKIRRFLRWLWMGLKESRRDYDVVFIKYFPGCSVIRLLTPWKQFVFDIRTGSICRSRWRRKLSDAFMVIESQVFRHVTVISESLAKKIGLRAGRYHVLPLGADVLAANEKHFDELHLLYVGTLSGREIEKTILGFEQFYHRHKDDITMSYRIVGDGYNGELEQLRRVVVDRGLEGVVKLLGYVHHSKLGELWEMCNVGVSFIPINDIYDCQPATKTFEYLLAGMPVIATGTAENRRVVSEENGVVIDDTADSFAQGLEHLYMQRVVFVSAEIRRTLEDHCWEKIVGLDLIGVLTEAVAN